jgi:CheY-like chemotaxis protein
MVDDLMEVNRIAAGKIRLDPRPMDLAESVRRCVATLSGAGRTERHALAVHGEAVWVEADPVRVEQIVVNLLDNALKYTPPGGAVDVTIARESGHGVLRVRDTGVGIPREMLARIFDLFVQGEPGPIRGRSGLGIGLAVVQRLAELHGGTIEAASDGPGRGSTFRLRLRSAPAPRAETPRARRAATDTPRRRIVVVEDDPDIRGMLRRLLEASGHAVAEAEDGPGAFETAVRVRPDLMLVDIGLAGFDGYELARRLRMMPETKSAVLVALTGYGRPEDVARARAAGFDHHAVKPLAPDALAEILRR